MRSPGKRRLQHRIILLVVGNDSSPNLRANQLREILKGLCVSLNVAWRERPQSLQSGIIQNSFSFPQQKR